MLLQMSTTGVCHAFLWFPHKGTACSAKIPHKGPSCTMWVLEKHHVNPHLTEQDTLPIVFLISKQAIPYQTHSGTCCPGVSTPKIRSLADSSNHIT
jgi:hypothetical protein